MSDDTQIQFLQLFFEEALEILERWESTCLKLSDTQTPALFDELFRSAHNLKGSARSVGLTEVGKFVHVVEDGITLLRSGTITLSEALVGHLLDAQKVLVEWIQSLASGSTSFPDTKHLTTIFSNLQGSHEAAADPADLGFGFFDEPSVPTAPVPEPVAVVASEAIATKADESIRVPIKKLDAMIRLVGELSIQSSILATHKQNSTLETADARTATDLTAKITQDLQSSAMSLRMQPIGPLFQRLERTAKDVARQLKKNIRVEIIGDDVELDKMVLEQIKDPLVHIVRNAVDHGICSPDERRANGKPEFAVVTLQAEQKAGSISITVKDDGRGLDEAKIRKKALEKKLIADNAVLDKVEIHQLIFAAGFSTAEKITDVSGRGVGMDVVKKAVESLRGDIKIDSTKGQGSTFTISLPSTLTILEALIIDVADTLYSVPIHDIEEVLDISTYQQDRATHDTKILKLGQNVLPLEKLEAFLRSHSLPSSPEPSNKEHESRDPLRVALVTKYGNQRIALAINRMIGQQTIVIRQLEETLAKVPGFTGATILGNGQPSMILDLHYIGKYYFQQSQAA